MKKIILVLVMCALSACSLAPKYTRPEVPTPDAYKETGKWVPANPSYSVAKCCGPWWTVYSDPVLNSL
jgi:multidrug efflux system outer membrane protein